MSLNRERINDFRSDFAFIKLKQVATSGRGGRGPLYDKGVISVIEQIEANGSFVPNPISVLAVVPRAIKGKVLTPGELEGFEQMAARLGMTMEQASELAAGIKDAESYLGHFTSQSPVLSDES